MKKHILQVGIVLLFTTFLAREASAQGSENRLGVGLRYHTEHSVFEAMPFDKGDLSALLAYEYHEADAFWQLGLDYAWEATGTTLENTEVDYLLTPQINLILKDNLWRGGVGALKSYTKLEDGTSEWSDVYWQFMLGLKLPTFGRLNLTVSTFYVFEEWNDLSEFSSDDLEFGAKLSYSFK